MKELKGIWSIDWLDIRRSYLIFWSITLGFIGLFTLLSITIDFESTFTSQIPVIIYLIVIGTMIFKISLRFGLPLGTTRKYVYFGTVTFILFIALLSSFIHNIIFFGLNKFYDVFNINMSLDTIFQFTNFPVSVINFVIIDFAIFVLMVSISFLLAMLWQQLGSIPLYLIAGLFTLSIIHPQVNTLWLDLGQWILTTSLWSFIGTILIVGIVLLLVPYPFIRHINVFIREKAS